MIAQAECEHDTTVKFGRDRKGNQRLKCKWCGKTFTEPRKRILGNMRIPTERAELILTLLMEGNSVRSVERITKTDKQTILALLVEVGDRCSEFLRREVRDVLVDRVECDELWSPVFCRERTRALRGYDETVGDCYTYLGIEPTTKMILAFHVGRRNYDDTETFCFKLSEAVGGSCQIDTDGWKSYQTCIPNAFGRRASHGILVKSYGRSEAEVDRYERAKVVGTKRKAGWGNPDVSSISTSLVERANLGVRTQCKRFARLTLAYSKSRVNHEHAVALYVMFFNYCRVHSTIKTSPAVKTGLASHVWSIRELLERTAKVC